MARGGAETPTAGGGNPKRRRLPGVNLRPGSVKQARLESHLSLAQLGKGHVTAPAIYLVETGRTRPSLPTLEHIARRTGKPVEYFLAEPQGAADDTDTRLIELEMLVAGGRHADAIALGKSLLDRSASAYRLGRIRLLLGQAYLADSEFDRAAGMLEDARAHFEAVNDGVMLAESIGAQARLAIATQSGDAVGLAEKALAVCRGLKPVPTPTEARLLGVLAAAGLAALDWDRAIGAYEEAIEIGSSVFDLHRVARLYGELGAAYNAAGDLDSAARYGLRSVALLEVLRDRAALARSENSLGQILMGRRDFEGARMHLRRALELGDDADREFGRSRVLLSQCELSVLEGDTDRAFDLAREAEQLAERLEDGATMAEAHVWLGRVADLRGEHAAADRQFEDAIHGFEAMGMRERLLQTHGVYAEILERRGELARAYVHMKEALQASRPGLLQRELPAGEKVNSA